MILLDSICIPQFLSRTMIPLSIINIPNLPSLIMILLNIIHIGLHLPLLQDIILLLLLPRVLLLLLRHTIMINIKSCMTHQSLMPIVMMNNVAMPMPMMVNI